jgi:hypothetical protein
MAQPGSQALARLEEAIVQARVRREAIASSHPPHDSQGIPTPSFDSADQGVPPPAVGLSAAGGLGRGSGRAELAVDDAGSVLSSASKASGRPPHLIARDALLEECNASLLCEAFDAAGVESIELMSECAFEELLSCIGEETPRGKLNAIQTRQLRKAFDLACARGSGSTAEAVDGVADDADAEADADTGGGGGGGGGGEEPSAESSGTSQSR